MQNEEKETVDTHAYYSWPLLLLCISYICIWINLIIFLLSKRPWGRGTVVHYGLKVWVCIPHLPLSRNAVRCRYNAVNFFTKRHPIARPLGRGIGCLLWIQHLIYSASAPVIIHVISYNIVLRYNGTRLYMASCQIDRVLLGFGNAYTCRWVSHKKDVTPLR